MESFLNNETKSPTSPTTEGAATATSGCHQQKNQFITTGRKVRSSGNRYVAIDWQARGIKRLIYEVTLFGR